MFFYYHRWTRRWYLLVIVLLYVGLLASFSLNVSLLLRKGSSNSQQQQQHRQAIEGTAAGSGRDQIFFIFMIYKSLKLCSAVKNTQKKSKDENGLSHLWPSNPLIIYLFWSNIGQLAIIPNNLLMRSIDLDRDSLWPPTRLSSNGLPALTSLCGIELIKKSRKSAQNSKISTSWTEEK